MTAQLNGSLFKAQIRTTGALASGVTEMMGSGILNMSVAVFGAASPCKSADFGQAFSVFNPVLRMPPRRPPWHTRAHRDSHRNPRGVTFRCANGLTPKNIGTCDGRQVDRAAPIIYFGVFSCSRAPFYNAATTTVFHFFRQKYVRGHCPERCSKFEGGGPPYRAKPPGVKKSGKWAF